MDILTFLILAIVGIIGYIRQSFIFTGLGIAMFFTLALLMFSGADVEVTQTDVYADQYGNHSGTVTSSINYLEENSYQVGWLMMFAGFGLLFIFIKALFNMGSWY